MMSTTRPTESRAHVLFLRLPPILFKCHPRQFHSKSPRNKPPISSSTKKKNQPQAFDENTFYLCLYFLLSRIILFRADCRHYTRVPVPEHTQNRISTPPNKHNPTPTQSGQRCLLPESKTVVIFLTLQVRVQGSRFEESKVNVQVTTERVTGSETLLVRETSRLSHPQLNSK